MLIFHQTVTHCTVRYRTSDCGYR